MYKIFFKIYCHILYFKGYFFYRKLCDTDTPKITDNLKQFREEGNFDVHDIIKKIESNYSYKIKEKVKLTLDQLLQLYRRIYQSDIRNIKIEDENILKQIHKKLSIKDTNFIK